MENKPLVTLERVYLETESLGSIYDLQRKVIVKTMELPWKDNNHNVSCIPEGLHRVVKEAHSTHHEYPHFRLPDVKDRNGILIHLITYVSGLLGCIGVGSSFADFNKDGVPDIKDSSLALNKLYAQMPDEFYMLIKSKNGKPYGL